MTFKPTPKVLACAVTTALLPPFAMADEYDQPAIEATAQNMEVIVVSGSRSEKALKDVAGSISVISEADIEKQVISDMSQLFKYDPSIQVTGSVGQAQNIIIRGMGGDRVLMIKDGMRMNEGYGANGLNDIVGRGFIDTDTIKQVEVAKGAASSLYGSDALAGIVIFTTKDASDYLAAGETFGGKVKTGYSGKDKQHQLGATLALKAGQFDHLFNVSVRKGEEEQNYRDNESPFDIDSTSLLYKTKYRLNSTDYIGFSADIWQQDTTGDRANGLLAYFRNLASFGYHIASESAENEKETQAFKLSFHSETATPFYDTLNIHLYSNDSEQIDKEFALLDINAPMFGTVEMRDMIKRSSYIQDTVGFLSNANLKLNSQHTLGYGLDVEKTESSRHEFKLYEVQGVAKPGYPQETDKFPKTETLRAGLFINDEISLLDGKLTVTPGVRLDTYKMDPKGVLKANGTPFKKFDEQHTSFNIGTLYKLNDELSVFAQYGQGFKVPAYDKAYIEHYNQASSSYIYQVVPSDDLSPEESDNYEIGIRGQIGNFAINGAIFYSQYDQFLSTELINSDRVFNPDGSFSHQHDSFQYQNIDAVTIKGAEFGATYYVNNQLSIFANAAYQDGKDDETDEYITSISPLSGIVGLAYTQGSFNTELIVNWAKKMTKVADGNYQTSGYGSVDWLAQYEITDALQMNISVANILDKEYIKHASSSGHAKDDLLENLAEPGRNISASISYQF